MKVIIFLLHYKATKSVRRKVGSNTTAKVTAEMKQLVEEPMQRDDETSAHQLHQLLVSRGYNISAHSILGCRTSLGWTFRGSAYCHLIHDINKQKRVDWVCMTD